MIRDFLFGFQAYFKAFQFIAKHRLWKYAIIPGVISILIGAGIISIFYFSFDNISFWLSDIYPFDFGKAILTKFAAFLASILGAAGSLFLYKYLIVVIASPFMSLLSEKAEFILNPLHKETKFTIPRAIRELVRGLSIAVRNIVRELSFTLGLIIMGFVPVVGVLSVPLIFIVQAYYAGFGNMDFYYERFYNIRETIKEVKRNQFVAIGNGTFFLLLLMIPVVGLFIAPSLGCVAATICCDEIRESESDGLV